jgi:hypothetical protein
VKGFPLQNTINYSWWLQSIFWRVINFARKPLALWFWMLVHISPSARIPCPSLKRNGSLPSLTAVSRHEVRCITELATRPAVETFEFGSVLRHGSNIWCDLLVKMFCVDTSLFLCNTRFYFIFHLTSLLIRKRTLNVVLVTSFGVCLRCHWPTFDAQWDIFNKFVMVLEAVEFNLFINLCTCFHSSFIHIWQPEGCSCFLSVKGWK